MFSLILKIQNTDNLGSSLNGNSLKKFGKCLYLEQDHNATVTEDQEEYPTMDADEAIDHITKLAEKVANEENSKSISITVKNSQGIVEKYTLIPTQSEDTHELDYVLVVTQPQKEFIGDAFKPHINGTIKENLNSELLETNKEQNGFDKIEVTNGTLENKEEINSETNLELKYVAKLETIKRKRSRKNSDSTTKKNLESTTNEPSKKGVFDCKDCDYVAQNRTNLSRHLACHLGERPFKCEICEKSFKTSRLLAFHMNGHRGIKPYKCDECPIACCTPGELIRHRMYKHVKDKKHRCPDCDYTCIEYSKLRRHVQAHVGYRPYACPHCTFRSVDNFKLKRHLRIHTGEKPYRCDACKRAFNQSNTLKLHMRIHSDRKAQFKCHLCPAMLTRKTDLRVHFNSQHSNNKPLICKKCGKFFPDRYAHRIHNKTHLGERCFKCELCSFAGMTRYALQSHMYIHTDERPFKCPFCNKAFRQKYQIPIHVKSQHEIATADLLRKIGVKIEFCEEDLKALTFKGGAALNRKSPRFLANPPANMPINQPAHMLDHSYSSSAKRGPNKKPYVLLESLEKTLLGKALFSAPGTIQNGARKLDSIKCETTSPKPEPARDDLTKDPNISAKHPCLYCLKYYKTKLTLRMHYKRFHGVDKPYFTQEIPSRLNTVEEVPGVDMYNNANTITLDDFMHEENAVKSFIKEMQENLKLQNCSEAAQNPLPPTLDLDDIIGSPKSRGTTSTRNKNKKKNGETSPSGDTLDQGDDSIFFGDFFDSNPLLSSPLSKDDLEATLLNAFTDWDSMKVCNQATRKYS